MATRGLLALRAGVVDPTPAWTHRSRGSNMRLNWLHRLAALPLARGQDQRRLGEAVAQLYSRFMRHSGFKTAASLTYTTLFAVVPLSTVLYSMLAAVPEFQGVGEQVQGYLFQQFVPATGQVVLEQLNNFSSQARNLTFVGLGFLFITAVMMMVTIEQAFNDIWQVGSSRSGVSSFLMYWAVLTLGPLLIGAAFVISSYVASLRLFSDAVAGVSNDMLLSLLSPLLSFLAFLFIYMVIPNYRVRLHHAAAGAVLTALLIELAKFGFGLYVANFPSYQLIYGAFAAVPLFLLWIYTSWLIILLGAEFIAWLAETQRGEWRRFAPLWQALAVLAWLHEAHRKGESVSSKVLVRRIGGGYRSLMSPMVERGWIAEMEGARWVLAQSLETLPLWRVIEELPWPLPLEAAPSELLPSFGAERLNEKLLAYREQSRAQLDTPVATLFEPAQSAPEMPDSIRQIAHSPAQETDH
ncbi:hypothetical protein A5892_12140 [Halotalea alkalilenta]|uniref:UPF0761 membrane protein A5892_12140 n=2 Tax=Halotalea alkalilenta TaxID=376489 RepID=A0A172YGE2_9GAMM|nr:hypothetical protein A5892_12140 [Halotalea alkalilenta]